MAESNITNVPFALEAGSSEELSALMLSNNLAHNKAFAYHITTMGKKFQAWYYQEADAAIVMKQELDKITGGK